MRIIYSAARSVRKMTVFVVTVSFNTEPFLKECLTSVESQQAVEIFIKGIFVGNKATDRILETLNWSPVSLF